MIFRVNVTIEHYGDWSIITKNFEGINIYAKYFYPYKERGYSLEVIKVESNKNNEAKDFIKMFNKLNNILKVLDINKIDNSHYEIIFLGKYDEMLKYIFLENNNAILKNSIVKNGLKTFNLYFILTNKSQLNEVYDILKDKGKLIDFNVERIDNYRQSSIFDNDYVNLTPTERLIIEFAYEKGFFDTPRQIGLDEIARKFELSKTTVNFHIRSAIKKILRSYLSSVNEQKISK